MTSISKSNPTFISGFVMTGNFSKDKIESLLETHLKICRPFAGISSLCKGACDSKIPGGQPDYLIVGTVLSEQYLDKQLDLKNDVKKCTDF